MKPVASRDEAVRYEGTLLSARYGRGLSIRGIPLMCAFYRSWPIVQTPSAELGDEQNWQTPSAESMLDALRSRLPFSGSAYVRLLSVRNKRARTFCEAEALRGGWTVRQLDRGKVLYEAG